MSDSKQLSTSTRLPVINTVITAGAAYREKRGLAISFSTDSLLGYADFATDSNMRRVEYARVEDPFHFFVNRATLGRQCSG
jgi:hypothetical protein